MFARTPVSHAAPTPGPGPSAEPARHPKGAAWTSPPATAPANDAHHASTSPRRSEDAARAWLAGQAQVLALWRDVLVADNADLALVEAFDAYAAFVGAAAGQTPHKM